MLRRILLLLAALSFGGSLTTAMAADSKPNVLLIGVDDLNDWIGVLGGHPQAKTPNIDRLASRGVLFANAHCQSPVCNPSRASMMTSLYPETSGIYFLNPEFTSSSVAKKATVLPKHFQNAGYHVAGAGKIFHGRQNQKFFPNYAGNFGGFGPTPKKKLTSYPGHPLWDWGVFPKDDDSLMPDVKTAAWGVSQLKKSYDQPFFLATGFFRPHVPQYVSQKWFDLHPTDAVKMPAVKDDDLSDLSKYAINLTRLKHVAPTHEWVLKNDEWKPLVQSYLACVSFVDAQVGKVVDALEKSPYADNTYIVLFSDHGFHLGEKERWAKRSLWEDSTRVPLIVVGPGVAKGQVCRKPVELIDVYPTLLELTGQKAVPMNEGQSLAPLLKDPSADWPHVARTSFGPENVAIRSERYRYIRYHDGSEEFYDHDKDPHEWNNQINSASYADEVEQHKRHLPKSYHAILGQGSTGHKSFEASEPAPMTGDR